MSRRFDTIHFTAHGRDNGGREIKANIRKFTSKVSADSRGWFGTEAHCGLCGYVGKTEKVIGRAASKWAEACSGGGRAAIALYNFIEGRLSRLKRIDVTQ